MQSRRFAQEPDVRRQQPLIRNGCDLHCSIIPPASCPCPLARNSAHTKSACPQNCEAKGDISENFTADCCDACLPAADCSLCAGAASNRSGTTRENHCTEHASEL